MSRVVQNTRLRIAIDHSSSRTQLEEQRGDCQSKKTSLGPKAPRSLQLLNRHRLFSSLLPMLQSALLSSLLYFSDLAYPDEVIDAIIMPARYLWLPPAAVIRGFGGLLVKLSASSALLHVATMRLITRWKTSAIVRRSNCYIGGLSQCLCCLCSTPSTLASYQVPGRRGRDLLTR